MKGFSLLELSIVVAIIALLTAGTTAGYKMLERVKLLATIKQIQELESSVVNFYEKYRAYPGDFSDAFRYFDDGKGVCGTEADCNGDGDFRIEIGDRQNSEVYRAWQHLALAKIIKGHYSGVWGEGNYVMQAKYDGNFTIREQGSIGNIIKFGNLVTLSGGTSDGGVIIPEFAEQLDIKLDDGMPTFGQVRGLAGFLGGDIGAAENYDNNCLIGDRYRVNYTETNACTIAFILY